MGGVRWAFPCASWRPRREEWLLAARLVQPEEKERIGRLVFARDAKAALVPQGTGRGAPGAASSGGAVGRAGCEEMGPAGSRQGGQGVRSR